MEVCEKGERTGQPNATTRPIYLQDANGKRLRFGSEEEAKSASTDFLQAAGNLLI